MFQFISHFVSTDWSMQYLIACEFLECESKSPVTGAHVLKRAY